MNPTLRTPLQSSIRSYPSLTTTANHPSPPSSSTIIEPIELTLASLDSLSLKTLVSSSSDNIPLFLINHYLSSINIHLIHPLTSKSIQSQLLHQHQFWTLVKSTLFSSILQPSDSISRYTNAHNTLHNLINQPGILKLRLLLHSIEHHLQLTNILASPSPIHSTVANYAKHTVHNNHNAILHDHDDDRLRYTIDISLQRLIPLDDPAYTKCYTKERFLIGSGGDGKDRVLNGDFDAVVDRLSDDEVDAELRLMKECMDVIMCGEFGFVRELCEHVGIYWKSAIFGSLSESLKLNDMDSSGVIGGSRKRIRELMRKVIRSGKCGVELGLYSVICGDLEGILKGIEEIGWGSEFYRRLWSFVYVKLDGMIENGMKKDVHDDEILQVFGNAVKCEGLCDEHKVKFYNWLAEIYIMDSLDHQDAERILKHTIEFMTFSGNHEEWKWVLRAAANWVIVLRRSRAKSCDCSPTEMDCECERGAAEAHRSRAREMSCSPNCVDALCDEVLGMYCESVVEKNAVVIGELSKNDVVKVEWMSGRNVKEMIELIVLYCNEIVEIERTIEILAKVLEQCLMMDLMKSTREIHVREIAMELIVQYCGHRDELVQRIVGCVIDHVWKKWMELKEKSREVEFIDECGIHVIEYVLFYEQNGIELIKRINYGIRKFIQNEKIQSAMELIEWGESLVIQDEMRQKPTLYMKEFEAWMTYKSAMICYKKYTLNRNDIGCDITIEKLRAVIQCPGGWLLCDHENWNENDCKMDDEVRHEEIDKIRKLCLPYIVMVLYSVFYENGMYKEAMEFIMDVFEPTYGNLIECFETVEIKQLLKLMKNSVLEMSTHENPFSYSILECIP